jgi:hypothetical protein
MTQFNITEPVVYSIGLEGAESQAFENVNNVYDIAIAGQPFLLAASDRYPYQRQTAQYRKQQFDNSQEPGEQTFEGWWLRSQSSFHLGAGINYLDPITSENVQYRFNDSAGVDVWTPGQVTMLNDVEEILPITGSINMIGAVDSNDEDIVLVGDGANFYRIDSNGVTGTIEYGGGGTDILSIAQDGTNYYVANNVNIYTGDLTGTGPTGTAYYGTGDSNVKIAYVKQRLVAAIGPSIYEITSATGATGPLTTDRRYTHPNPSWEWTAIVEGPTAIYASGYSGTSSNIYKFSLSNTGVMPTLTSAITAADFPDDEYVMNIGTYLGRYMIIGTSKGIRVGIIDDNGDITYGPIVYEKTNPLHKVQIAFRDKFAYVTVTNAIAGKSGVIRIDLSQEIEPGRYAFAKDLSTKVNGCSCGIAFVGKTGKLAIAIDDESVFFEDPNNKIATGFLDTGYIRYGTIEKKYFKLIKPRIKTPMVGSMTIATKNVAGGINSIITLDSATPALNNDLTTNISVAQEELAFRFIFNRSVSNPSNGPQLDGYQVKSLPAVNRNRQLSIPLLNFDFESDRYGVQTGYEGRAFERLQALETVEAKGDTILIQDFTTDETVLGLIEQLSFERNSAPKNSYSGFGGIIYVSVRTV